MVMELVFRKSAGGDGPPAQEGEIHLRPHAAKHRHRRDLARLVLEQGPDAFHRGSGPVRRLVLDAEPTLDDLFAAAFLVRQLSGEQLPPGCATLAEYAALAREGLRPGSVPVEHSLEGVFLALRNAGEADLTDAANGTRFAGHARRLTDHALRAAAQDIDPFTTSLFGEGADFAREQAFLARDREVYQQDVNRGQQWLVRLPGGPPRGAALFLRSPKSLLFKHWSRCDSQTPSGAPYLLLAVASDAGQWVFSTDPVQRLSLLSLAEQLQAAEQAQAPERAKDDPWFDGKPFGHTLVAAPRGGTVLSEDQVLRIVKRWAGVRSPRRRLVFGAASCLAVVPLVIGLGLLWRPGPPPDTAECVLPDRDRSFVPDKEPHSTPVVEKGRLHVLAVGLSKYRDSNLDLGFASADAAALAKAFQTQGRELFADVSDCTVLLDKEATRENILGALERLKKAAQYDLVVVSLAGHGANLDYDDDFYFLPYDYDDAKRTATGVYWDDLKRVLHVLPCCALVVVDACHSGTITRHLRSAGEQQGILKGGALSLSQNQSDRGMVVIAACLGSGRAQERAAWGHGALTLALLEGLSGHRLYQKKSATPLPQGHDPGRKVSLADLDYYVTNRVEEIAGTGQAVISNQTGDIRLANIFVASRSNPSTAKE
jgi:hypothetical protein